MMPLTMAIPGKEMTVQKVGGSAAVKQHLNEIGFNVGSPVTVVSVLNGSIIVKVKESRFALDSAMANKIVCIG
jgi:ferrous iron transport protein A